MTNAPSQINAEFLLTQSMGPELWGWCFYFLSYALFFGLIAKQRQPIIMLSGFFILAIYGVLSWSNAYFGPFVFAQTDPWSFYVYARSRVGEEVIQNFGIGAMFYKAALIKLYQVFGSSLWLGQSISVLFFMLCCAVLVRFISLWRVTPLCIAMAIIVFGLLPSSLLYAAYTAREVFMTGFFMLGVWFICQTLEHESNKLKCIVCAALMFVLMGLLHQVLLVYAVLVIGVILVVFIANEALQRGNIKIVLAYFSLLLMSSVFLVLLAGGYLPVHLGDNYFAMADIRIDGRQLSIAEAVNLYRESINQEAATTIYGADLSFSTWLGMFGALLVSYSHYLGWQFSGDYSQLSTWIIFAEAIFRIIGLVCLFALSRDKRFLCLLLFYISLSFVWNIGTTNHGQALRHHFMTQWILVIAISVYLNNKLSLFESSRLSKPTEAKQ